MGVGKELGRILQVQLEHLAVHGTKDDLLFPSSVGTPIRSSRISDALRAARKKAGITKRCTSHGLRRSMNDLLREAEVDPVIAKAIVGHTTDRMREHYSTLRGREVVAAAGRVERVLFAEPSAAEAEPRKVAL